MKYKKHYWVFSDIYACMKQKALIIQRLDAIQKKWYDIGSWDKKTDVKRNLQSIQETQSMGQYRVIQRVITEKKVKI